jgi:hypothetical protein
VWSNGQSSWLQIQRSGFDYLRYQIFQEVIGLELGPFSVVSTIEELLGKNSSGSGLEGVSTATGIRYADHATPLYQKKLALASQTSGGRSN